MFRVDVELKTEGIRYLGYELGGGTRGHIKKQIGLVHAAVDEIAKSAHARTLLSVERALWTWVVYARFIGEKGSEVFSLCSLCIRQEPTFSNCGMTRFPWRFTTY